MRKKNQNCFFLQYPYITKENNCFPIFKNVPKQIICFFADQEAAPLILWRNTADVTRRETFDHLSDLIAEIRSEVIKGIVLREQETGRELIF